MSFEATEQFNLRLRLVPDEWRGPIVEVIDTIESVNMGLASIGINDSSVLIEATRLVLQRHDNEQARKSETDAHD